MTAWLIIGMVLAIWRVTRLLVSDALPPVAAMRRWFITTFAETNIDGTILGGKPGWGMLGWSLAYVWTCPWCMSVWVGLAVWGLSVWPAHLSVPYPWFVIAAGSLVAGVAGQVESLYEQIYERNQRAAERDR